MCMNIYYRACIHWLRDKSHIILDRERPSQNSLGHLAEIEAGVNGKDLCRQ